MFAVDLHGLSGVYVLTPTKVGVEPTPATIKIQHSCTAAARLEVLGFSKLDEIAVPIFGVPIVHFGDSIVHWLFKKKSGASQPMFQDAQPTPPLALALALQNILAVTLVELVKVFQLGWQERKVIRCECNARPHDSELGLKVLHHVA